MITASYQSGLPTNARIHRLNSCANQINGLYRIRGKNLAQYADKVKELTKQFVNFKLKHIPRSKNKREGALSKLASSTFPHLTKKVLVEIMQVKEIDETLTVSMVEEQND